MKTARKNDGARHIKVSNEVHKKLKMEAVRRQCEMKELADDILLEGLRRPRKKAA